MTASPARGRIGGLACVLDYISVSFSFDDNNADLHELAEVKSLEHLWPKSNNSCFSVKLICLRHARV